MVYVVYIRPHVLCHLGLIFILANAFSFFTQKQFQAHERESGYMFRESVISFNPFKTDENTEATTVLSNRLGLTSRLLAVCPALTTVLTALPAKVSQAIIHSFQKL